MGKLKVAVKLPVVRTLWRSDSMDNPYRSYGNSDIPVRDEVTPNLISSETDDGFHAPVIDCDYEIEAVPSSTPGHFHLYINRKLTWDQYKALLIAFRSVGLIEQGWFEQTIREKRSFVRRFGVYKPFEDIRQRILETGVLFEEDTDDVVIPEWVNSG